MNWNVWCIGLLYVPAIIQRKRILIFIVAGLLIILALAYLIFRNGYDRMPSRGVFVDVGFLSAHRELC